MESDVAKKLMKGCYDICFVSGVLITALILQDLWNDTRDNFTIVLSAMLIFTVYSYVFLESRLKKLRRL